MKFDHLYQHQENARGFLATNLSALLAHEPGLGKTATAIAAADTVGALHILVLCPAVGKPHWAKEFGRFQKVPRAVTVIHGVGQPVPAEGVVIVNYDLISRLQDPLLKKLLAHKWDVLICDEAHALKSRMANRTRAVYGRKSDASAGLASVSERVWLLTGTPMPSNASELWTHLRALVPVAITTETGYVLEENAFVDRYCTWRDTPFGRKITGSKNLPELREKMKVFMDRKRKTDVLTSLPPLTFDTLLINPNDAKTKVPKELLNELRQNEAYIASTASADEDLLAVLQGLKTDTHITTQRRLTGLIKVPLAVDLVTTELMGNHRKIIIFAHHKEVIDNLVSSLADAGLGVVKLDGRDTYDERVSAVEAFQTDPLIRVFVGQLTAAGTSITLTASSDVLFVEASWVPAENVQAACRAHRIGQRDGVLARFLTLDGSLDRQIMTTLAQKAADIATLIDNETPAPKKEIAA